MKKESSLENSNEKTKTNKVVETKHEQPKNKRKKSKERGM